MVHSPRNFAVRTLPICCTFSLDYAAHLIACFAQSIKFAGIDFPNASLKRRSVLRPLPASLLLVMMLQTSLTIAVWQRIAKLLISDKAAMAELACG